VTRNQSKKTRGQPEWLLYLDVTIIVVPRVTTLLGCDYNSTCLLETNDEGNRL
jgi:hypothetical protein